MTTINDLQDMWDRWAQPERTKLWNDDFDYFVRFMSTPRSEICVLGYRDMGWGSEL